MKQLFFLSVIFLMAGRSAMAQAPAQFNADQVGTYVDAATEIILDVTTTGITSELAEIEVLNQNPTKSEAGGKWWSETVPGAPVKMTFGKDMRTNVANIVVTNTASGKVLGTYIKQTPEQKSKLQRPGADKRYKRKK